MFFFHWSKNALEKIKTFPLFTKKALKSLYLNLIFFYKIKNPVCSILTNSGMVFNYYQISSTYYCLEQKIQQTGFLIFEKKGLFL